MKHQVKKLSVFPNVSAGPIQDPFGKEAPAHDGAALAILTHQDIGPQVKKIFSWRDCVRLRAVHAAL